MIKKIEKRIENLKLLKNLEKDILKAQEIVKSAILNKNKILFCANGGSAADCAHLACEFVAKFKKVRKALCAISLCENNSIITAVSNDFSFEDVFARQIEALGEKNDVLFAISTSGKSKNVLKAIKQAKKQNLKVIFLTGENKTDSDVDLEINCPSKTTAQIQEMHLTIGHLICEGVDEIFS